MSEVSVKQIFLTIVILLTYILQITLVPEITVFGVSANLCLIVVCSISFLFGSTSGGIVGFFCGILIDFYYGRSIGLNALLYLYIGIVLGSFNKRIFKDNYLVILFFMIITTFLYEFILYIYGIFTYSQSINFLIFMKNVFIVVCINTILSFFIYPILLKLNLGLEIDRNIFK